MKRNSPSKQFHDLGIDIMRHIQLGVMKGGIIAITHKRSKYKLINKVTVPEYIPFTATRINDLKEWYF